MVYHIVCGCMYQKKNMKAETKKKTREPGENVPRNVEKKL